MEYLSHRCRFEYVCCGVVCRVCVLCRGVSGVCIAEWCVRYVCFRVMCRVYVLRIDLPDVCIAE